MPFQEGPRTQSRSEVLLSPWVILISLYHPNTFPYSAYHSCSCTHLLPATPLYLPSWRVCELGVDKRWHCLGRGCCWPEGAETRSDGPTRVRSRDGGVVPDPLAHVSSCYGFTIDISYFAFKIHTFRLWKQSVAGLTELNEHY